VLNETQTKELEIERTNLMSYLRKSLQNFSLQLAIEMDETIVAQKILTTEEKLIQLEQRNPHFSKFRERLGLQPE
jgi:DNA polymerase-3 subunit gamma/tau